MSTSRSFGQRLNDLMTHLQPGFMFIVLIFGALIAFELFNYSTTDHALQDLLGGLEFGPLKWSTILAFAFCGIDFAGIARLFTPEQGIDEPKEVWYLFGAWILAATMNAILTWWGVSMAIVDHQVQSASIVDPKTIATVVPVFVAVMVRVIRILIIGTLSLAMDRLLHPAADRRSFRKPSFSNQQPSLNNRPGASINPSQGAMTPRTTLNRPNSIPEPRYAQSGSNGNSNNLHAINEPTYHSLAASAPSNGAAIGDRPNNSSIRR